MEREQSTLLRHLVWKFSPVPGLWVFSLAHDSNGDAYALKINFSWRRALIYIRRNACPSPCNMWMLNF